MFDTKFVSLLAVLALTFASARAMSQNTKTMNLGVQSGLAGSTLICTQPNTSTETGIRVPLPLMERAKTKARLAALLRQSLFDDANGIVNIAREKEIRKLVNKLRHEEE